jgi:hypothetical protein
LKEIPPGLLARTGQPASRLVFPRLVAVRAGRPAGAPAGPGPSVRLPKPAARRREMQRTWT